MSADDEKSQKARDGQNADMMNSFKRKQRVWIGYPVGADQVPTSLAGFKQVLSAEFTRCDWAPTDPYAVIEVYARPGQTCPTQAAT
jgi:hypothetical protein